MPRWVSAERRWLSRSITSRSLTNCYPIPSYSPHLHGFWLTRLPPDSLDSPYELRFNIFSFGQSLVNFQLWFLFSFLEKLRVVFKMKDRLFFHFSDETSISLKQRKQRNGQKLGKVASLFVCLKLALFPRFHNFSNISRTGGSGMVLLENRKYTSLSLTKLLGPGQSRNFFKFIKSPVNAERSFHFAVGPIELDNY